MPFLLFYITYPDENTARQVSDQLIEQRLVACANIFPVAGAYRWSGGIEHEGEWISILKTRPDLENRVEEIIRRIHPYQTPCILRFEVRANADYEAWIVAETAGQ